VSGFAGHHTGIITCCHIDKRLNSTFIPFQFVTILHCFKLFELANYFVLMYQGRDVFWRVTSLDRDLQAWLCQVRERVPIVDSLLQPSETQQLEAGYYHTLREICQQPMTWEATARRVAVETPSLRRFFRETLRSGPRAVVLTGSGSSYYAGECVAPALQKELELPVICVPGGDILTDGIRGFASCHPYLLVSLARSGDSPESCGVVDHLLASDPGCYHLLVTCNEKGKLASSYRGMERVSGLVLDDRTCDRSLVMTSSFTNLVLAARILGMLDNAEAFVEKAQNLSRMASGIILQYTQALAEIALNKVSFAVYLGSGCNRGAAREASLKMLEMSGGYVKTLAETYLGLRHGPMAAIHPGTLVVCFLSSDCRAKAYELDLIREIDRKQLGVKKVIIGEGIPEEILRPGDLAVECPRMGDLSDSDYPMIHVLVGQLLAFFHCRALGLRPDAPSASGVINRVVEQFPVCAAALQNGP
jgi:tagatose-6-phosphate ketose/aldose isomerase